MIGIITLLIALTLTLLITRVATVALVLTGMSKQSARFQARSALSTVGFTTSETESIMDHPVRRRIIMMLMLIGNVGIVTVIATVVASMVNTSGGSVWVWTRNLSILFGGLTVLIVVANSEWIDRQLSRIIEWGLRKYGQVDARDYAALFHLADEYAISELLVNKEDWLAGKSLIDLDLPAEGVLVLGIQRNSTGVWIGAPRGRTEIHPGDTLILYGLIERLADLDQRRSDWTGMKARAEAVRDQEEVLAEEDRLLEETEDSDEQPAESKTSSE